MSCKICRSPHRAEYERLYLEGGNTLNHIYYKVAVAIHNENCSFSTLKRHFRLHVIKLIEVSKQVDLLKKKKIEEEFKRDIQVAQTFRKHLITIEDEVSKLKEEVQTDPRLRRMLLEYIKAGIDTIEKLLKWGAELGYETKGYEVEDKIAYCMQDFPMEYIEKFKNRWEAYGRQDEV